MNQPESIAIIRLSSLGDIIHTLPAFQVLRERYPDARISWIVEPVGAALLKNFEGIDQVLVLDLKQGGFFDKWRNLREFLKKYRRSFDLIIDFQGLIKSALLSRLLKGYNIGFNKENLREPLSRLFYRRYADPFDEKRHVIHKNIHLLSMLNIQNGKIHYPMNDSKISENLNVFMLGHGLEEKKFVIVNVGGGWRSKVLEIEQNIDMIERLKGRFKIVILWGNDSEREAAETIADATGTIMSEFLEFDDLIALIKLSALLITADTLALHIADMVGTPSVGVFGPTLPQRNGSLLEQSAAVYEELTCSFCYRRECDTINCMKKINIDKIVESAERIYEKEYH